MGERTLGFWALAFNWVFHIGGLPRSYLKLNLNVSSLNTPPDGKDKLIASSAPIVSNDELSTECLAFPRFILLFIVITS